MLDRKGKTTLFRLRTGHCGLNKHLKKMGMAVWSDRTYHSPHPPNLPHLRRPDFKFGLQKLQSARSSGDLATTY